MESFINSIENQILKEVVDKIVTLFNELQEKDRSLAVLLVEYLIKHFGINNENDTFTTRSTISSTLSKCTQTDSDESHNGWDMKDITNEVKQVAEKCMNETGLNYDKSSGTYYNSEGGYYYIPDYRLYYYPALSAYYYYDDTTDSLKFHSSVSTGESSAMVTDQSESPACSSEEKVKSPLNTNYKCAKVVSKRETIEDKEEGELSSSDDENLVEEESQAKVIFESGPKAFEPDHSKHNAPCMRMVIVKTALKNYNAGTLFLITRDGATLGREGINHEILLTDSNVSKEHLKIQYVYKGDSEQRYVYEVVDLGSRNGTWVNGKRLSPSNEKSEPEEIYHGTIITVGSTTLLCHIHKGMDFCSECQSVDNPSKKETTSADSNLTSKQQYHKQVMKMKQKYQLNSSIDDPLSTDYVDRAQARRDAVGSSHHSEKTEVSSVHVPMNKNNKGYDLLSKMGWKEGNNLGKNTTTSLQEPLYVEPKVGKGGFGAM